MLEDGFYSVYYVYVFTFMTAFWQYFLSVLTLQSNIARNCGQQAAVTAGAKNNKSKWWLERTKE